MTLKRLTLSENAIASLYTTPLVHIPDTSAKTTSAQIKFMGSNQQHITILVNATDARFLNDKYFAFLSGILNACKLSVADVAIINIHQQKNLHHQNISTLTNPKIVLLFGVAPEEIGLPLHFPHFQVQPFNHITYLSSPSLDKIEADKLLKTQLWTSLKSIFQL